MKKEVKCFWCGKKAVVKDWREIDGCTGSFPSCKDCYNSSTEWLLDREHEKERFTAGMTGDEVLKVIAKEITRIEEALKS